MVKDRIQQVADRMANERFEHEFYELPESVRMSVYDDAEREVMDHYAAMADAAKGSARMKRVVV